MFYLDQYIYVIRTYHIFKATTSQTCSFEEVAAPASSQPASRRGVFSSWNYHSSFSRSRRPRLPPASLAAWRVFPIAPARDASVSVLGQHHRYDNIDKQQKTHFKSIENILIYENYTLMWLASLLDVYTTSRPRGVAGAHCSLLVLLVGNLVILTLALDANTGFDVIETNTVSI